MIMLLALSGIWSSSLGQSKIYNSAIDSLLVELETPDDQEHHLTLISDMVKHSIFTNTDTAEYFTRLFIEVAEGYNDSLEMARGENFLGMVAYVQGHNEVAIMHYLKAIPQFEKAGDLQMVGILRNNVAAAYSYRKKHQETVEQYEEALKVFTELKDTLWIASVTYNLANEYHNLNAIEKSEAMHKKSLRLFRYLGDSTYVGYSYLGLGNIALDRGQYQKALAHFNRSAELTDPELDLLTFANIDGARCKVCIALEKYNLAEFYCKSGIEVSKSAGGYYNLANSYSNFYQLEQARGNYKLALQYSDSMKAYQDSLSNQEKDADILEMVAKFESEKNEQALEINKIQLRASERRNKLFLVGLILLGLLVAIGITLVVQTIRNNRKLAEKNNLINKTLQEKEVLLKEIHHRVKNNLQVITSLLSIQSREISDPIALEAVKASKNRVKSMAMIHQNLYKQDSLSSVDGAAYINNICSSVLKSYQLGDKEIKLEVDAEELELNIDTTIPLGLILNELITNSLKYAFVGRTEGSIKVILMRENQDLKLQVIDNGVGMNEEDLVREASIGMKLIEAFAKKLKATWSIKNKNGTIITFRFNYTAQT